MATTLFDFEKNTPDSGKNNLSESTSGTLRFFGDVKSSEDFNGEADLSYINKLVDSNEEKINVFTKKSSHNITGLTT